MEYFAKITGETKVGNLWKYDFTELKNNKKDFCLSNKLIDFNPYLPIKLDLVEDEKDSKILRDYEQDISWYVEESQGEKTLTNLSGSIYQVIENLDKDLSKKEKIKFPPWKIWDLKKNGLEGKKMTFKAIAKLTGYNIRTIRRWLRPRLIPKRKNGRKRKLDDYSTALLLEHVKENNKVSQEQRAVYISKKRNLEVHRSTISRTLKREEKTRKRGTKRYYELDPEEVKQFIKGNYQLFSSPFCYALDEFGVNLGETSRYAYARKGCRAIIPQKGQKGFNHTVILCVRNIKGQPVVSCKIIKNKKKKKDKKDKNKDVKKGTNALDFYNFLKYIKLPTGEQCYILLDNSRIHFTTKELASLGLSIEELARQKNIMLVYLPKYAPQINPAELCNNFIKGYIRGKRFLNEEELKKTIEEAIDLLNKEDLTKWFRHCRDYFSVGKINH